MKLVMHLVAESAGLQEPVQALVRDLWRRRGDRDLVVVLTDDAPESDVLRARRSLQSALPASRIITCQAREETGEPARSNGWLLSWAVAATLQPDVVLHVLAPGQQRTVPPDRAPGTPSALLVLDQGRSEFTFEPTALGHDVVLVGSPTVEAAGAAAGLPVRRWRVPLADQTWSWLSTIRADRHVAQARKSLAVVAPWPPLRTGVSDFAVAMTALLAEIYDVTVVAENGATGLPYPWVDRATLRRTWWSFDRVLYHLGNSLHHAPDLLLMAEVPGAVVVHDAVLSGALSAAGGLGHPHGVMGLLEEEGPAPEAGVVDIRGARSALAPALGILVHSRHSLELLRAAGVTATVAEVAVHPAWGDPTQLSAPAAVPERPTIAHFGFVNAYKGADRLVSAAAQLSAQGTPCEVVFVGEFATDALRVDVERLARNRRVPLTITGFVDEEAWTRWLGRVSCAIQLREASHGESSGSLVKLFLAGVPVVCSEIGSFAELPPGVVRHVPVGAGAEEIAVAVRELLDPVHRSERTSTAKAFAREELAPEAWAAVTARLIERSYAETLAPRLGDVVRAHALPPPAPDTPFAVRGSIGRTHAAWVSDVSVYAGTTFFSGVQRVTRRLHEELVPMLADVDTSLHPTDITERLETPGHSDITADPVVWRPRVPLDEAEWLLCVDLNVRLARHREQLLSARRAGLKIAAFVYDLMPVLHPEWFPEESGDVGFGPWLRTVLDVADVLIAISEATAADVRRHVDRFAPDRTDDLLLEAVPLGWDFWPDPGGDERRPVGARSSEHFLMVGTVEPRKGHADVLDAFERLWAEGSDTRLTVVGRQGWLVDDLARRLDRLDATEPCLQWLKNVPDEELDRLYESCTAVIMASLGEGFGLPIVEAAHRGCPVVVRDIPVLREVAGDGAAYFESADDLVDRLREVMRAAGAGTLPPAQSARRLWREVAEDVQALLWGVKAPTYRWSSSERAWL